MGMDLFKPQKLKISIFKNGKRSGVASEQFDAMFNPTSYKKVYALQLGNCQGKQRQYISTKPSELTLDLILDGTGVDEMGVMAFARKSVKERVQEFLNLTYGFDGAIHESNYLIVEWGELRFPCRLSKVTVEYTLFDRDGLPLRAKLTVELVSDNDPEKEAKKDGMESPDLTHARIVRSGDTLPLLTKEIYGSADSYLDVARFNGLDDFRNLTPGMQLLFPPLAHFGGAGASRRG